MISSLGGLEAHMRSEVEASQRANCVGCLHVYLQGRAPKDIGQSTNDEEDYSNNIEP
jgi:hypothetical protein